TCVVTRIAAADRRRGPEDVAGGPWRERADAVGWLVGERLGPGITPTLLERFGGAPEDRPLLDVLVNLAPGGIQCLAAMSETWQAGARGAPSVIGMGGLPDSCWMWRRDGVLSRTREAERR